jgi:undecaprenyl-diphosphatase
MPVLHLDRALGRARRWLGLTRAGWLALGAATVCLAGSGSVLAAVTEDVVGHTGETREDGSRLHWFVTHRPAWLISLAKLVTQAGGVSALIVMSLLAAVLLYRRGQALIVAMSPSLALGTAGVLAAAGKQIIGRSRPPLGVRLLPETESSFPSGHATDSTALFVALALVVAVVILRKPLARVASALIGFGVSGVIGLSRLVLGVHWPTDVVAGWTLGTTVALMVTAACLLLARAQPVQPANGGRTAAVGLWLLRGLHVRRGGAGPAAMAR